MDIRGIEVTNQLRSAIRAKLLELGVRYDEELPDYILVMVVNKKTRQQMHEDLYLFLEDSTTPFVEWMHDQVLKKLQKVTVAKKKVTREFVPMVVVKQEEERRKRKNSVTAPTEAQSAPIIAGTHLSIVAKDEKHLLKDLETLPPTKKSLLEINRTNSPNPPAEIDEILPTNQIQEAAEVEESIPSLPTKSPPEPVENDTEKPDKKIKDSSVESEDLSEVEEDQEEDEKNVSGGEKRLKSCVNKPKITSVVSVKNRLSILPVRKNFEAQRARNLDNRNRKSDNRFDLNRFSKNSFLSLRRQSNFQRGGGFVEKEIPARNRSNESNNRQTPRANEAKNRIGNLRDNSRFGKNSDTNDEVAIPKLKTAEKRSSTIKDRLGVNKNVRMLKQSAVEEAATRGVQNTIKNRIGRFRSNFRVDNGPDAFVPVAKLSEKRVDVDSSIMEAEDDRDVYQSMINVGPVKSHVTTLKRSELIEKRPGKRAANGINDLEEEEEEDADGCKSIASKVIVTPRPLKPLQPTQKRATQSLLLRAVAEANQSVVKQKNPEPVLTDKNLKLKRPKPAGTREVGKNISVHLNATKRLVMEKIQVQLRTADSEDNGKSKQCTHPVNDEHIGVLMSLFQRSDDNQQFLVTLNGYNNNIIKEKSLSDEGGEQLEMEVTEDEELLLSKVQNDSYEQNDSLLVPSQIVEAEDREASNNIIAYQNNENHNSENYETPEVVPQRKRRKLSPIVYTRSNSPNPSEPTTMPSILPVGGRDVVEQRSVIDVPVSTVADKSRDKCRYWPNCTAGSKCAYYHPAVPCGAFPACKFGDKCAYKHPQCKFGLSCSKLGCAFSHPKQQCKFHPFCTKPKCPYSHVSVYPVVPTETVRAKFTWKRRD